MSDHVDDDRADHYRRKAAFCLRTGVQPSEYDQMSDEELEAFIDEADRLSRG